MTSESDIVVNPANFRVSAVPDAAKAFNKQVAAIMGIAPPWYSPEMGAAKFRALRTEGKLGLPAPVLVDNASPFSIPSRDAGRAIPCRVIKPVGAPTGVFMHIHGGGWVLGDEKSQDPFLQGYVQNTGVLVVSVGYRLAPEDPYPAPAHDCYDVAEWLVQNAEKEFGAPLDFISGESAGGHLTALTAFHLLTHPNPKFSTFQLKGLVLHFGCFDLGKTPSYHHVKDDPVLNQKLMDEFLDAFIPDKSTNLKDPAISPLYFNFSSLPSSSKLPPAIFACGTSDLLLDDTIFMSAKWQAVGGEAVVKIVPGAPHGFTLFGTEACPGVKETLETVYAFMKQKL